jgi:hypothetical protein
MRVWDLILRRRVSAVSKDRASGNVQGSETGEVFGKRGEVVG